jgi:flavodoxin/ferredoxin
MRLLSPNSLKATDRDPLVRTWQTTLPGYSAVHLLSAGGAAGGRRGEEECSFLPGGDPIAFEISLSSRIQSEVGWYNVPDDSCQGMNFMPDVTIVYFSQTGNTRKVAETASDVFRETGSSVRCISLQKASAQDMVNSDLLGVGTPCFSSQAPTPVKKFLQELPPLDGKQAFVFATSGGSPGRVLYDVTSRLRKKGANVIGGFLARGECHHPAPCLNGRCPGRPNQEDLASARRFAQSVVEYLRAGRSGSLVDARADALRPGYGFYDSVAFFSVDPLVRRLLPEPKLNPDRCNECQWCVDECPMDNITAQPYPVLGRNCIRCYRCLSGCPQQAFHANWRFGNPVLLSMYSTSFERWFGDLEPGEAVY